MMTTSLSSDAYAELLSSVPDIVTIVDTTGTIQYANPAAEHRFGHDTTDIVGTSALEYVHPDDRDAARDAFLSIVEAPADTAPETIEYRARTSESEWRWVESRATTHTTTVIDGYVFTTRDIDDRKTSERTITTLHNAAHDLLTAPTRHAVADQLVAIARDVIALPHACVFLEDAATGCLQPEAVNGEAPDIFGPPPTFERGEGLVGHVAETGEALLLADAQRDDRGMQARDNTDTIRGYIVLPLGDHGVFVTASPTVDAFDQTDFEVAGLLASYGAVRLDQVAARDALEQKTERLEAFGQLVSHDLRNPLNVAQGYLGPVRQNHDSDDLAAVDEALARMETIIEDMLTLANESEPIEDTEAVSLATIAEQVWPDVGTADATLSVEADLELAADPDRLRQLLENLFRNAVDHGGHAVTVTVGPAADGSGFYVADDGSGLPADIRDHLFEMGVTTASEGTGYGLSIVREIATAHGWTVTATESTTGGARFELTGVSEDACGTGPTDTADGDSPGTND